jgi:hypothetical protein
MVVRRELLQLPQRFPLARYKFNPPEMAIGI